MEVAITIDTRQPRRMSFNPSYRWHCTCGMSGKWTRHATAEDGGRIHRTMCHRENQGGTAEQEQQQ